ncbi:MAG TPA: hypothetical protein VLT45_15120 [Kofleriaceae bacterium]|nr:hypothetical protein [Kofleriaceae bacterium]
MTAFYALSFEDTGMIVGFCQLGKRDLTKPGAVAALLDQLVGDTLEVQLGVKAHAPHAVNVSKLTLQKTQLSLDEVKVPDKRVGDFTTQPWSYLLDLTDPNAKPGDGTTKQLLLDPTKIVTPAVNLYGDASAVVKNTLRVSMPKMPTGHGDTVTFYAIINGTADTRSLGVPFPSSADIDFGIPATTAGTFHTVLFASRGVTPTFDVIPAA